MSDYLNFSIQTKTDLKNWILRQMGYPLITVELRDEHLEDCINDAVEEYTEYAAQEQKYYALNLRDYVCGKGYYLPGEVQAVTNLYDYGVHGTSSNGINPFSFNFMMVNGGFVPSPFNGRSARSGWFDYHLAMSWLDLTYQMTGKGFEWEYNQRTKLLTLNPDPIKYFNLTPSDNFENDTEGCWIIVECFCLRPEEQQFGETWVKRMALAKAKYFLGNIRSTYTGINLPGGAQMNGDNLMNQGKEEQETLRQELLQKFPVFGIWHG
jgi:hypothetical protein